MNNKIVTKTAIKLAKSLDFSTADELFNYMVECYYNGNFSSCKSLFFELKKEYRKNFLNWCLANQIDAKVYSFYFNLL